MFNLESYWDETLIRSMIVEYLNNSYVAESINYIHKILDEAYQSGITYDVSDLQPKIIAFANTSTHMRDYCISKVSQMYFKSRSLENNIEGLKKWEIELSIPWVVPTLDEKAISCIVKDVKVFKDKVVKVYFVDGSYETAVCKDPDIFDLDIGITICLMKKLFGSGKYFKLLKNVHKIMDVNKTREEDKKETEAIKIRRREKRARYKERRRKRRVAELAKAIAEAEAEAEVHTNG